MRLDLDEDDAPDWSYWQLVPTVTLFEAVSLSLNIDPRKLVPHPAGGGPAGIAIVRHPPPEFYNRLEWARRCVGETLPAAKPRYGEEHIRLQSFTEWATSLGWEVPPELEEALAGEIEPSNSIAKSEPEEPTHTGMPGRPAKSKHLIDDEFKRRTIAGETLLSLADEAKALWDWLIEHHPKAARPTIKTIQENIRTKHREHIAQRQPPDIA